MRIYTPEVLLSLHTLTLRDVWVSFTATSCEFTVCWPCNKRERHSGSVVSCWSLIALCFHWQPRSGFQTLFLLSYKQSSRAAVFLHFTTLIVLSWYNTSHSFTALISIMLMVFSCKSQLSMDRGINYPEFPYWSGCENLKASVILQVSHGAHIYSSFYTLISLV